MKLSVLSENYAGQNFLAEHGLSFYIIHDGVNILFDTGASDVFLKNASKMNINPESDTDWIILSHGHWDHGNGLEYLGNLKLLTHPKSFIERFHQNEQENLGISASLATVEEKFELTVSEEPFYITNKIIFLGEIPRRNDFESQSTTFVDKDGKPDFVPDDSALVLIQDDQLIIISGCAHAGICNIIDYAISITGIKKVRAVIGGFHLRHHDTQTDSTIEYFVRLGVDEVYPSHCTQLPALAAFYYRLGVQQLKTGMVLSL